MRYTDGMRRRLSRWYAGTTSTALHWRAVLLLVETSRINGSIRLGDRVNCCGPKAVLAIRPARWAPVYFQRRSPYSPVTQREYGLILGGSGGV